jgi:transcriptional regulator with XRE-family HTH domain
MTVGQRIFYLLEEKKMTQVEFSKRTGIATTTISDWRKKNTNPGSEKIMAICAALEVTPEYLLSGVCEDSKRGKNIDYMVIPQGTEERELLELFNDMAWLDREHLLEYAKKLVQRAREEAR